MTAADVEDDKLLRPVVNAAGNLPPASTAAAQSGVLEASAREVSKPTDL